MRQQDRNRQGNRERDRIMVGVALACGLATFATPYLGWSGAPEQIVWPPAGVALALMVLFGVDVWPAAFAGMIGAGVAHSGADTARLSVAAAAVAEAYAGAWLVNRWACGAGALGRSRSFVRFAIGGGLIAAALGPALGVPALALVDRLPDGPSWNLAFRWWLGDSVSTIVLAPALLLWRSPGQDPGASRHLSESVALAAAAGLCWVVAFGGLLPEGMARYPLEVLAVPPLLWAAYRYGPRVAALTIAGLVVAVVVGTAAGHGPFVLPSAPDARLVMQVFTGVTVVTTLALATVTAERRIAEGRLLQLVRTDGLTGLTNYRGAIDALQAEVSRGLRHGDGFAVLFLDLDGLKEINDSLGHLTGNRALLRLARAIELNSRSIDVASRLGGDEFCIILPGADALTATQVAERITRTLDADRSYPRVRASVGVAVFPHDGSTAEELLGTADTLLYGAKARRATSPRAPGLLRAGTPA